MADIAAASWRRLPSLRRMVRIFTSTVLLSIIPTISVLGAIAWTVSDRALQPETYTYWWGVDDFATLDPEPIRFQGADGVALAGRFFEGSSDATVILSHGFAATQDQLLPWVYLLNEEGFNVFTYDMRSRGQSGGEYVTFGALEQHDLLAAVDYVASRPDVDAERIAAAGLSLGGSVSILAAAQDTRIQAVVSVSGFSDAKSVVHANFDRFFDIPSFPFAPLAIEISERRADANIADIRPVAVIDSISPRPVMLIHGEQDEIVSPANGTRLNEAAGEPKRMMWVDEGGHDLRRHLFWERPRYEIIDFLVNALDVEQE